MNPDTALIVIDIQNDFCPGGALAVNDGDQTVASANALIAQHNCIILTQDWHPSGHSSFASQHHGHDAFSQIDMPYGPQTLWPDHCIAGSKGAEFHPDLNTDKAKAIIRKGQNPALDSYSAFFENDHTTPTGLAGLLHSLSITNLHLCGLATDFCVAWSAIDARKLGFAVTLELQACRAIDLYGSLQAALEEMRASGVVLQESG